MKGQPTNMAFVLIVILVGLLGGLAVGIQAPMANVISDRIGILESTFFVHLSGAIVALIPLLALKGGNLTKWDSVPWYMLWAGAFGLVLISTINFTIPHIGVAGGLMLVVIGQMIMAVAIDHFGWLNAEVRPVTLQRVIGLVLLFAGVWFVVR